MYIGRSLADQVVAHVNQRFMAELYVYEATDEAAVRAYFKDESVDEPREYGQ